MYNQVPFASNHAVRGMTILEVLIATLLVSVLALIIFSSFAIGLRAAALASRMSTATGLAEDALTRATADPCGSSMRAAAQSGVGETPPGYERQVTVTQLVPPNLWEISATVSWTLEHQRRSVTLTTYRYISQACSFIGQ
jgi:type II secretory pathway pseudopilin PulG